MEVEMNTLAIDIAKAKFDVCELQGQNYRYHSFENHEAGFKHLLKWFDASDLKACHICMEATNSYGFDLAEFLYQQGFKLSLVNPASIKAFANSELSRNKTDKLDAGLMARFCAEKTPRLWHPATEYEQRFKALNRRFETLKDLKAQEQTRLNSERCADVKASLEAHIAYLDEQVQALEAALDTILKDIPELKQKCDLLRSIPGIGKITAYQLIAEIPFAQFETVNQLVAFAGLNPRQHQSGTFKGKTPISKMGSARLRKALYFPAISAMTWNPFILPLAQPLKHKGHSQLSIICAAMRKLLHLAFGVIKHNQPFDPKYLHIP